MEWKLKNVIQETSHPYLNFFTLVYEVKSNGDIKEYQYYLASRHNKDELFAINQNSRPDGIIIPCYYKDENGDISLLITSQYRPALNHIVTSVPAGLMEKEDDIFTCAKREALEEAGVVIDNLELIATSSPTSSGLSDELCSVVLGEIKEFKKNHLEEFEDITYRLIKLNELEKMMEDPRYFFALNIRLLLKYLLIRWK